MSESGAVRSQLLRAKIRRGRVESIVAELEEHLREASAERPGESDFGDVDELCRMLIRSNRRHRSTMASHPLLVCAVVLPAAALAANLLVLSVLGRASSRDWIGVPVSDLDSWCRLAKLGAALLVPAVACRLSMRQGIAPAWALVSCLAVAISSGFVDYLLESGSSGHAVGARVAVSTQVDLAAALTPWCAYLVMRSWRSDG